MRVAGRGVRPVPVRRLRRGSTGRFFVQGARFLRQLRRAPDDRADRPLGGSRFPRRPRTSVGAESAPQDPVSVGLAPRPVQGPRRRVAPRGKPPPAGPRSCTRSRGPALWCGGCRAAIWGSAQSEHSRPRTRARRSVRPCGGRTPRVSRDTEADGCGRGGRARRDRAGRDAFARAAGIRRWRRRRPVG